MVALLPTPELQFIDADGHPYSGGTLETYVPSTTTPKSTWLDPSQSALNTNPIILDAAGRCIVFGDGAYRLILRDSAGNLVFDQYSDTIVSAAMQPVISAPTIEDAVGLLGINDLIAAEASARAAADSAEAAARTAADNAEASARAAEDTTLQAAIDAETARAEAAEAAILNGMIIQQGYATTDGTGHCRVTFTTPYTSGSAAVFVTQYRSGADVVSVTATSDDTGCDVWLAFPSTSQGIVPATGRGFTWLAIGF
jgi:hypothetical protein